MLFISEWYWKCIIKSYVQKVLAVCAVCLSISVVWSEVTFFNKTPVLSIFAIFVNLASSHFDYFTIEVNKVYSAFEKMYSVFEFKN